MQAATLNENLTIQQWDQQDIEIIKGPTQMIIPLVSRMAARNRTRRAGDRRFETMDLWEIDTFATNAKHPEGVKDEQDKVILRLMQTGSSWDTAADNENRKGRSRSMHVMRAKGNEGSCVALRAAERQKARHR